MPKRSRKRAQRRPSREQQQRQARKGEPLELRVERLASSGEGWASLPNGQPVLVEDALAGERVSALVIPGKPARASIVALIEPAPERLVPECEYARASADGPRACGGCDWMHMPLAAQNDAHVQVLRELLKRLPDHEALPEIVQHRPSPALGYRARIRLGLQAQPGLVRVGYHRPRSRRLVDVNACLVADERLQPCLAWLRAALADSRGDGEAQLALGAAGLPTLRLEWSGQLGAGMYRAAADAVDERVFAGIELREAGVRQAARLGDPRALLAAPGGGTLRIAAGGFAQASEAGGVALAERVAALVQLGIPEPPVERLVELFAGSGTLSLGLAGLTRHFLALEHDAAACDQLRLNLADHGLSGRVKQVDANASSITRPCHTVVLDPPRSGAAGACRAILAARPKQVVYVACNPRALVQDLTQLLPAYRITAIELFELFPQTSHFETVVRLVRC